MSGRSRVYWLAGGVLTAAVIASALLAVSTAGGSGPSAARDTFTRAPPLCGLGDAFTARRIIRVIGGRPDSYLAFSQGSNEYNGGRLQYNYCFWTFPGGTVPLRPGTQLRLLRISLDLYRTNNNISGATWASEQYKYDMKIFGGPTPTRLETVGEEAFSWYETTPYNGVHVLFRRANVLVEVSYGYDRVGLSGRSHLQRAETTRGVLAVAQAIDVRLRSSHISPAEALGSTA